jgi:HAMP domain-containing protein
MKLLLQFNLIFVFVLGLAVGIDYLVFSSFFQKNAQRDVMEHATLMLQASRSVREYTSAQIDPLIQSLAPRDKHFYPQTVPGYAATENFSYLRKENPEYTYREATLNPTNLRDRATDWEADIINVFRNNPDKKDFTTIRSSAAGQSMVLARPIVAKAACLQCHSTPQAAPASIIRQYGNANGFGWQLNEIVGAQIISVPMDFPNRVAKEALRSSMTALILIALLTLLVLNITLAFFVIKPVSRLAARADEISKGNLEIPELPASGHNEISVLAQSFNRMHRSLKSALKMLGQNLR